MSESSQKVLLGGLARKLIQKELIKEAAALTATEQSLKQKRSFVTMLVENKQVNPAQLALFCAKEFGMPLFDLNTLELRNIPYEFINQNFITEYHAVPIYRRGNRLFVAISDPTNFTAMDELRYKTNMITEAVLVEENKFADILEKVLATQEAESLGTLEDAELEDLDILSEEDASKLVTRLGISKEIGDAPIVRFINKVILDAVNMGASDLHFEPYERMYRVRFRYDGILYEHASPPVNIAARFAARIKVMARLDISEKRLPQDGRFRIRISATKAIDFRVSTCPTIFGEKIVLRVLDPSSVKLSVDLLGLEPFQKELFLNAIKKPHGMVLVTGPTGSGKTVSLYTALNALNTSRSNISTCEDPIEINLQGINQVNVNPKAGLSFATALRTFLRQDPDIIMVGEIRDVETAEIAVKAAQTGHLVLSTLHTNSASDTVMRLINMGVPSYNTATSILLVIAQRLARVLCTHCKKRVETPEPALIKLGFSPEEIPQLKLYGPNGCDRCKEGYKGRTGIFEILEVSPAVSNIILNGGNPIDIYKQAVSEGMWDLRKSGLEKVKSGVTSIEELYRITKD
jgi:type IV pilus assembly protein PilB